MSEEHSKVFRFGVFELDVLGHTLRRRGVRVRLQEKPLRLLGALLEKPNQIVTREALIQQLWPEEDYGEFDLSLNTAVRKVRRALGESAGNPKWIETVPKVGYRFLLPVEPSRAEGETDAPPPRRVHWAYLLLGLAVVMVASAALVGDLPSIWTETETPRLALQPLTSYPGYENHPDLSPDGTRVAFVWNGGEREVHNIYVRSIEDETLTQVTDDPGAERHPAWSPDGLRLAFLRPNSAGATLFVSPLSEPNSETPLAELNIGGDGMSYGLDWSPDGRFLALQNIEAEGGRRGIFLVSAKTGEMRRITTPPAAYFEDRWPSFSPDGRSIAFARGRTSHAIYMLSLDGTGWPVGNERQLTQDPFYIRGVDWNPDGRSVIFAGVTTGGRMELRNVDVASKVVTPLLDGVGAELPSVVRRKSDSTLMVAFVQESDDNDLFRIPGPAVRPAGTEPPVPHKFVSSTRYEHSPRFSPDGQRFAFVSHRSGGSELWVADRDGSNVVRLTDFGGDGGAAVGSPRWSPDNQWIAFEAGLDGHEDLFLIASAGGEPKRLTSDPANEVRPSFSRDGYWLYFTSDKTTPPEIWKMPVTGGEAIRMTHGRGMDPFESADGHWLYYAKRYPQFGDSGIYRMPVSGGEEMRVLENGRVGQWALSASGIYLYRAAADAPPALEYYPHDTLRPQTLIELPKTTIFGTANALTVTPDDSWVVFVQKAEPSADLALFAAP